MKKSLGPLRGRRSEITISSWKTRQKTRRRRAEDAWKTCRIAIDRWKTIRIAEKKKFWFIYILFSARIFQRLPPVYGNAARLPRVFHASSARLPRAYGDFERLPRHIGKRRCPRQLKQPMCILYQFLQCFVRVAKISQEVQFWTQAV